MDQLTLSHLLQESNIDAMLVTNPVNIFYLTGFKGVSPTEREALLVLKKPKSILITSKLYQAEANRLSSGSLEVKIAAERNEYENLIKDSMQTGLPAKTLAKVSFESHDLTYAEYKKFKRFTKGEKFIPTKNLIEDLRSQKSQEEIAHIGKAQQISQKAFWQIVKTIKIGQTEEEVAENLVKIMKVYGSYSPAFEPIIASGPNSALPHYKTAKRKIKKGDSLLLDFGAKYKNYCGDFSRTIFIGKANDIQKNIYNHVFTAQQKAIAKIGADKPAKQIYNTANNYFKKLKLDAHFIHSLGHGIGLDVHEKPSISKKSKDKLTDGMVFSIEPGLYFSWGGVRIEDLVAMKLGKPKILGTVATFIEL